MSESCNTNFYYLRIFSVGSGVDIFKWGDRVRHVLKEGVNIWTMSKMVFQYTQIQLFWNDKQRWNCVFTVRDAKNAISYIPLYSDME